MYIIFNHDGSIKNLNLNEIIVQGNNLVNEIQIGIEGRTPDDYVATAYFTLPDGTSNYITGSADNFSIDQSPYSGYSINLTSAQTVMAGEVGMTIQCEDANSHVLCTYKVKLTVNESGYIPEATTITMAQYQSIISSLATFQQKFVANNARYYPSYEDAEDDLTNLATNQLAIVGGASTPLAFYFKNGSGNLQKISTEFFGYIELSGTEGTLTAAQTLETQKDFCIINCEGTYFFKTEDATEEEYIAFRTIPFFDSSDLIYADKKQQTIKVYPDDDYDWLIDEKDIYEGIVFQATELEPNEALTSIEEFLAECASYNADFSDNDGHRYHYSHTNPITHATTDYFAEFLGGDYSALVRVRGRVGAVNQTDKVYYCAYNTSDNEWEVFELASRAYVDEEAIGYFEIADSTDDRSGTLTDQQKGQAKKDFCVIKYTDSNGIPMYFINLYDYDTSNPSSRAFHCIEGWRNSSDEGISQEFREATIFIDDLDEGLTAGWEFSTTITKVDEEPTDGSSNLVTSNGVYDAIASAKSTIEGEISTAIEGVQSEITSLTRTLIHKDDYSTSSASFDAYGVAPKALSKASLDGFLGNSVVRNQHMSDTAVTVSTSTERFYEWSDKVSPSHKYIIITQPNIAEIQIFGSETLGTSWADPSGSGYLGSIAYSAMLKIVEVSSTANYILLRSALNTISVSATTEWKPKVIDLTQWFGSNDLIPADLLSTPALFLSKYAYGMDLSYNTGTLVDGTLTKLKANSFNVWDEEWEVGSYNFSTGAATPSSTNIRSKSTSQIKVIGGLDYYVKSPISVYVMKYDKNDVFLGYVEKKNGTFTADANCDHIRFVVGGDYGTTYHHDICINVSNADLNGTYLPHANPIQTSLSIGTMRSAGSVRDTNELTKVGQVDLGTLTWTYSSERDAFMVSLGTKANGWNNLLCSKYALPADSESTSFQNGMIKGFTANNEIAIKDSAYGTDSAAFKSAMNGVYLNYELATPTARATTFPELLDIHSGGIIEAEFTDLPITTQITYLEEE